MSEPLFRREVMAERQSQWMGTVLLTPHFSYRLFAAFGAFAMLAVLSLLFFGHYTRKARIVGWLVPELGLVQVFAPQSAVVTKIAVAEGAEVHKGDPLVVLSTEVRSSARGPMQTAIAQRLQTRRTSLLAEQREMATRSTASGDRSVTLGSQLTELDSLIALQAQRVRISRQVEAGQNQLHARGMISDRELQLATESRLEQDSRLRELRRDRIDLQLKSSTELANLDREIAQVEQELEEVEAQREIVIPAPESGTITSIQASNGGRADPSVPLMSLVPAGSKLEAHLFSPSRSIGFLRPGQRVLLRYEAYPYQKFGHYEGVLTSISRSSMSPSELPAQVAGLTRLTGTSTEPVYRLNVGLKSQAVNVYGKPVALQPGMLLAADVLIEQRRLIEWILDPVLRAAGR